MPNEFPVKYHLQLDAGRSNVFDPEEAEGFYLIVFD